MVKVGDIWTDGNRLFNITRVSEWSVWYEDCYEDGTVINRVSGAIFWEVQEENNEHWKIGGNE